ncbi:thiopurine S-methyltransferase [Pseudaestuariivita sp.]|uniref:thiopurine S-methyltransferase n=1 Tax=Pseudaestuariivita sp. TaxID=2211669 RepID=UPI004059A8F6
MTDGPVSAEEAESWHARWRDKRINFHQSEGHPKLRRWLPSLQLVAGARLFLPLCGKTGDIGWLRGQGFSVAGAELSEIAIAELFAELKLTPEIRETGALKHYHADHIDMYVGDIFALDLKTLGTVDAVYDRAALVALPQDLRAAYAPHVTTITGTAPQLLIAFDYDASTVSGPPYPVRKGEITRLYAGHHVESLADDDMPGGLKGVSPAREQVWHLTAR